MQEGDPTAKPLRSLTEGAAMPVTSLDIAHDYIKRGLNPVPIPHRAKRPTEKGWQDRVIDEASAPRYFNGKA